MIHPTTYPSRRLAPVRAALPLAIVVLALACSPDSGVSPIASPAAATRSLAGATRAKGFIEQAFEGTLDAVSRATYDPATNSNLVHLVGTVSAHPYGPFTIVAEFRVALATETSAGRFTLTARNGDVITATFTGKSSVVAPGVISIVEHATISGGTGRFAGATGTLLVERTLLRPAGTTSGSISGTIVRAQPGN